MAIIRMSVEKEGKTVNYKLNEMGGVIDGDAKIDDGAVMGKLIEIMRIVDNEKTQS